MKNFKQVVKINIKKNYFKIFVDKNNQVYEILRTTVLEWKKGKPSVTTEERDKFFFEKVKGNPLPIAIERIQNYIDYQ